MKYGFGISRIRLVPYGGRHNDTICTAEEKTSSYERIETDQELSLKSAVDNCELDKVDKKLINALQSLPTDYWDFKDADTKEYTHGLHTYPAVMISEISRNILRIMKKLIPIQTLFDPFSGSGTVLVEGMLAGINQVKGNDINPLALFLEKVKTTSIDSLQMQEDYERLISRLDNEYTLLNPYVTSCNSYIQDVLELDVTSKEGWGIDAVKHLSDYCNQYNLDIEIPDFKNIGYWFKPNVILELSLIKKIIKATTNKDIQDFFFVAFSETIRLVSNRRNGEFKMYRMPPAKVEKHSPDVKKEFLSILKRNILKMHEFNIALEEVSTKSAITIYKNSACDLKSVDNDCFDLIITSPPYGDSRTTVAYGEFSRLSLQWIDLFELSDKDIMNVDCSLMGGMKFRNGFEFSLNSQTVQQSLNDIGEKNIERAGDVFSFYKDLEKSIKEIARTTKEGGYHFWIVGNRTVKGVTLETDKIIAEMAEKYNMKYVYSVGRFISNKVMPSLNSPSNKTGETAATMTNEHIVILRKI